MPTTTDPKRIINNKDFPVAQVFFPSVYFVLPVIHTMTEVLIYNLQPRFSLEEIATFMRRAGELTTEPKWNTIPLAATCTYKTLDMAQAAVKRLHGTWFPETAAYEGPVCVSIVSRKRPLSEPDYEEEPPKKKARTEFRVLASLDPEIIWRQYIYLPTLRDEETRVFLLDPRSVSNLKELETQILNQPSTLFPLMDSIITSHRHLVGDWYPIKETPWTVTTPLKIENITIVLQ